MRKTVLLVSLAVIFGFSGSATATMVGVTLILNTAESPQYQIVNDSSDVEITDFILTIGDAASKNFDGIEDVSPGGVDAWTLHDLEVGRNAGPLRSDQIYLTFVGFDPGEIFGFNADIDPDSYDAAGAEYRVDHTIFDVDGSSDLDNSLLTVTFDDGTVLSGRVPDFDFHANGVYEFSLPAVPEPTTLVLLSFGLLGIVAAYRGRIKSR